MAKFNQLLSTFQAGEISPRFIGREDVNQYIQALTEATNVVVKPQGGVARRGGSWYRSLAILNPDLNFELTPDQDARIFEFETSDEKLFLIVIRPTTSDKWCAVNVDTGEVVGLNPFYDAALRTWSAFEISDIHVAQNVDYLAIVHTNARPLGLTWDGVNFTLGEHWQIFPNATNQEVAKRRAFLEPNALDNQGNGTLTVTGTGPYTITSSMGIFRAGHIGSAFKLSKSSATAEFIVTGFTSATQVTAVLLYGTVPTGAIGSAAGTSWEEEAWSTLRGFPRAVTFFEQRLVYGGTRTHPNRIWATQIGDIDELMYRPFEQDADFATYTKDNTRAFDFEYSSTETNFIRWLASGRQLFIGASGREYYASGTQGAMGPLNIDVKAATAFGSNGTQPVRLATSLIFVQRSGVRIRNMEFSYDQQDYKSNDLTLLAEHITKYSQELHPNRTGDGCPSQFQELRMSASPNSTLWALDNDFGLYSCTVDKENAVLAWTKHKLGGKYNYVGVDYPPQILSIAKLSSQAGATDDIWLLVRRTVNGVDKVYLEKFSSSFEAVNYINKSPYAEDKLIFADCAAYQSLDGPLTFFMASHLPNTTVQVVADGHYLGEMVTDNTGMITFPEPGYKDVIVGLKYKSRIVTVGLNMGSQVGSAKGLLKKVHKLILGFYRSFGARAAVLSQDGTPTQFEEINFVDRSVIEAAPPSLFTGEKELNLPGYERDFRVVIEQDAPYPCEVTYLAAEGQTYD